MSKRFVLGAALVAALARLTHTRDAAAQSAGNDPAAIETWLKATTPRCCCRGYR